MTETLASDGWAGPFRTVGRSTSDYFFCHCNRHKTRCYHSTETITFVWQCRTCVPAGTYGRDPVQSTCPRNPCGQRDRAMASLVHSSGVTWPWSADGMSSDHLPAFLYQTIKHTHTHSSL